MEVYHTESKKEIFTSEKCFITEILNMAEHPDLSIARARVRPGIETQLHSLMATHEYYYVVQGQGKMTVSGVSQLVTEGDCISIKAGEHQKIQNTGDDDLIFLCICLPRFQSNAYKVEE